MKKITFCLLILAANNAAFSDDYVNGYVRQDGTYVQPNFRSESNQYRYDNYSSQGNSNPYTGQQGHQSNEYSTPPSYNQSNPYQPYQAFQNPYSGE
jgi:hypothetical protein